MRTPGAATWPATVHATTVATNAIIEGKTARVGMLVTRGFRDILEIGRQIRSRLYDVHLQKPAPLVPRRLSLEVTERLDAEGRVLEPLDLDGVRAAVRRLRDEAVEAVVICFLHSYLNPVHERAAAAVVREEMPGGLAVRLVGGVPGVPRVPAREHGGRQRGGHADRVALHGRDRVASRRARRHRALLRDAVERRRHDVGVGQGAARLHGRVGAGRRRHRRRRGGRRVRLSERALVRHGRHHRQGRAHPGRPVPASPPRWRWARRPSRRSAKGGAAAIPCARR